MIRMVLDQVAIFLIPFALFALFLLASRRNPLLWAAWSDTAVWLVIAGLVMAIGAFVFEGVFSPRPTGAFEPTHMENGRLVPGRFK